MKRSLLVWLGLLVLVALPINVAAQARSDYKIAPHDIIVIDVFGEKDFSREFRVSATGTIDYPFVGEVTVAGKTTSSVREELTERLNADYLVEPQVSVDVKRFREREVFINGQVNKPGSILLTDDQELRILQAIARAGGLTRNASENKIKFTRPGTPTRTLSLQELRDKPELNIPVQAGDIIEVGDRLL